MCEDTVRLLSSVSALIDFSVSLFSSENHVSGQYSLFLLRYQKTFGLLMENPWFTDVSIVDEREHYPELGYWINKRRMKLQLHNLFLEKKK